jgi:hypothetical protein
VRIRNSKGDDMSVRTFVVVPAVLALVLASAALAAHRGAAPRTLSFVDAQQSFTLDPRGAPAVGSRLLLTKALFNRSAQFGRPAGARVGSVEVVCTIVSQQRAQCSVTAHVPDGEIVAMGAMRISRNGLARNTFAIVGGAGASAQAGGTVTSRDVDRTRSIVTLHLA